MWYGLHIGRWSTCYIHERRYRRGAKKLRTFSLERLMQMWQMGWPCACHLECRCGKWVEANKSKRNMFWKAKMQVCVTSGLTLWLPLRWNRINKSYLYWAVTHLLRSTYIHETRWKGKAKNSRRKTMFWKTNAGVTNGLTLCLPICLDTNKLENAQE